VAQIFARSPGGSQGVETDILFASRRSCNTAGRDEPIHHRAATQPFTFERIDNDAELAAAIARLGNVIVPQT